MLPKGSAMALCHPTGDSQSHSNACCVRTRDGQVPKVPQLIIGKALEGVGASKDIKSFVEGLNAKVEVLGSAHDP
jgi:hypothetical protein